MIDLLGAYLVEVKQGKNLSGLHLTGQSLRNYVKAAADCFSILIGSKLNIYDLDTLAQKRVYLHPYLHELITQRAVWTKPKPRKEPYTYRMLATQARYLRKTSSDAFQTFQSKPYAIWDWARLGIFTGSRLSEYAQSGLRRKQRFHCIPVNAETGFWGGKPIAFIRSDFEFYDSLARLIPHSRVFRQHKLRAVSTVHVRFRYDKGAENFSIRKFSLSSDPILDPVDAVVSILHRATLLSVPEWEPVGVYGSSSSAVFCFLRDSHVRDELRAMCIRTYPDPTHYLRLHIDRIVPHSNRVTAAVCLHMGGASIDDIAFRLRWHVSSVPTYLRECFQDVGAVMEPAGTGAFKTS
jgi:hypothetical protein